MWFLAWLENGSMSLPSSEDLMWEDGGSSSVRMEDRSSSRFGEFPQTLSLLFSATMDG